MHVAVLGAGYAGVALTRRLESTLLPDVDLTLVDERDTHLVQHLVHQVIREPEKAADLQRPLADLLDRATHRQACVESVDPDAGVVECDDGELSADVLAVCLGARTDFHGLPGVEEHATPLKRVRHAESIRERFLSLCEPGAGRAVVVGAGLSGIQTAGELAALADDTGVSDNVDVVLLEAKASVAPDFPDGFRRAVDDELRDRGVTVETSRTVEAAEADSLVLSDGELAYDQLVWTGGITGQAALSGHRPVVRARLRLGDRAFGLGDAVRVIDAEGTAVPASAKTALEQVDVAATNVERLLEHRRNGGGFEPRLATYRYETRGWLVTIGDGAVAQVGPAVLRGRPARAIKSAVATRYLRSLANDGDLASALLGALPGSG